MNITVKLRAQIKAAAGTDTLQISLGENGSFQDFLEELRIREIKDLNRFLFTEGQTVSRSLLFTLNQGVQVRPEENPVLKEGDVVTIFSPISGG
jgi:molybdopterin converting factor small subunit